MVYIYKSTFIILSILQRISLINLYNLLGYPCLEPNNIVVFAVYAKFKIQAMNFTIFISN